MPKRRQTLTLEDLLRDYEDRINKLEEAQGRAQVGQWRLSVDGDGNLVALNLRTRTSTVIAAQ